MLNQGEKDWLKSANRVINDDCDSKLSILINKLLMVDEMPHAKLLARFASSMKRIMKKAEKAWDTRILLICVFMCDRVATSSSWAAG